MNNYEKFARAEQLEESAERMYTAAAQRFASDEAARGLFSKLAGEEREHASRIRMMRSMYVNDRKLAAEVHFPVADVDDLIAQANDIISRLEGAEPPTIDEFMLLAGQLESGFAAAHAQVLAKEGDPSVRALFEMLTRQDKAHQSLLRSV